MHVGVKTRTNVKSSQKSTVLLSVTLGGVLVQNPGSVDIYFLCQCVHGAKAIGLVGKLYTIFTGIRKSVFHFFAPVPLIC